MSALRLINETSCTDVTSVSITDVFSADFDIYKITATNQVGSGSGLMRFINSSGSSISSASYDEALLVMYMHTTFAESRATNQTAFSNSMVAENPTGNNNNGQVEMTIFNPYSTSSYTFGISMNRVYNSSTAMRGGKAIGVLKTTDRVTGFQIYSDTSNYFSSTIRTYGLRVDNG
jgi:hypothetical protein